MNEVSERFFQVVERLGLSNSDLIDMCEGMTKQKLSNARGGRNQVPMELIRALVRQHHVNSNFILEGVGPVFNDANSVSEGETSLLAETSNGGVLDRASKAYSFLYDSGLVHNKSMLAERIGMNRTSVSSALNGSERYATIQMLRRINKAFGNIFSEEWIEKGEGNMLSDPTNAIAKKYEPYNNNRIRFVPVSATASFVDSLYDVAYDMETTEIPNTRNEIFDDTYVIFQVDGNSMEPTIHHGSKILAKQIDDCQWENASGVVVVVYGKSLVIKRIKKNALYLDNRLVLSSDNHSYGELDIERREIRGMWQALRIIDQDIV